MQCTHVTCTHVITRGTDKTMTSPSPVPGWAQHAVVVAERDALLFRVSQSQEACEHIREEMEALRRHSLSLQDSCTKLQTLNTQLQVSPHMDQKPAL